MSIRYKQVVHYHRWFILGAKRATDVADRLRSDDSNTNNRQTGVAVQENKLGSTSVVKVVPPGAKTVNITKGFDVPPGRGFDITHLSKYCCNLNMVKSTEIVWTVPSGRAIICTNNK
jgi:hypothetical protein